MDTRIEEKKRATILPLAKMSAVVFGSRRRMIAALKRFGLYLNNMNDDI
jgi:hypothetical protein